MQRDGHVINPSPDTLEVIKDKLTQHEWYRDLGIPTADFMRIDNPADLRRAEFEFGYPFLFKNRFNSYDGRGNRVVSSMPEALEAFGPKQFNGMYYAEKSVPFQREMAIIAAKSTTGDIALYPTVHTFHENNICHTVIMPAQGLDKSVDDQAKEITTEIAKKMGGSGLIAVEMYEVDGKVLVNESAPRPHNSWHATIEGSETSQFEQVIRAVTGMPLGSTEMRDRVAVMINILGGRTGPTELRGIREALMFPGVSLHIYGKEPTSPQRKMGHLTAVGDDFTAVYNTARYARTAISI